MSKEMKIKLLKQKHQFFKEQMSKTSNKAEFYYWQEELVKVGNEMWEEMN